MARGWESKSVEQQQAEASDPHNHTRPRLSASQQKLNRERAGLLLTRTRLIQQIATSQHAPHRRMLEQALSEIERQLACFEKPTGLQGI